MPRKCSVCARSDHGLIEAAVDDGGSFRDVGRRFSVALGSLHRHTQHARLAIEMDENTQREDLTSLETSRERMAAARAWKVELQREAADLRGQNPQKSSAHRPVDAGSRRSVAKAMHVDEQTLRKDERHESMADRYPIMEGLSTSELARRLGVSWGTARKAVAEDIKKRVS